MSRSGSKRVAPGSAFGDRLAQARAAAAQRRHLADAMTARLTQNNKPVEKPARPFRPTDEYLASLRKLPLHEPGGSEGKKVAEIYLDLVKAICSSLNAGGRQALLIWPAGSVSFAAALDLACTADCLSAAPVTIAHGKDKIPGAHAPMGLRALMFPFASTARRVGRQTQVDSKALAACQTLHRARALEPTPSEPRGFEDYHLVVSRVKTLTGKARDGRVYSEFKHATLDELVPISLWGEETPESGKLLSRVIAKTDLSEMRRSGLANQAATAPFIILGLKADVAFVPQKPPWLAPHLLAIDLTRSARNRLGLNWLDQAKAVVSACEAAYPDVAVLAMTDDPWSFDAARFQLLGVEKKEKSRIRPWPSKSEVIFSESGSIFEQPSIKSPIQGAEKIVLHGFGGQTKTAIEDLRATAKSATALGDTRGAEALRTIIGKIRSAASLPVPLSALSDFVTREMGDEVAAEQMAVYQVAEALTDLAHPTSAASQIGSLKAASHGSIRIWEQSKTTTPIALLLEETVKNYIGASSKCLFIFRSDLLAEVAYDYLINKIPKLSSRIENKMIRFTDVAGAEDLAQLPIGQRNYFSRFIFVAPTRATLLTALSKAWLPKEVVVLSDVDTLQGVARDALRLASFAALSELKPRLDLLARKAEECCVALGGHKVDLDKMEMPAEDIEFPAGNVVNLAGPSRTVRDLVEITFLSGQRILARPRTKLVVRDSSRSVTTYSESEAKNVSRGDEVCVIGQAFIERMRPLLNITAAAAEEIRAYHALVRTRFESIPGSSMAAKLRTIAEGMGTPRVPPENIRYWVSLEGEVEKELHEIVPHAPRDFDTFKRFMSALGITNNTADRFWAWAVIDQRSLRLRLGLALYDAYRGILVDPHGVDAAYASRLSEIKAVRSAAEAFVSTITSVRNYRA